MTIQYRGRTFTIEATGTEAEPYRLVGKRGGTYTLIATSRRNGLYWVKLPNGKIQGGFVGTLADGRLVWLTSGPDLAQWRREQAQKRVA